MGVGAFAREGELARVPQQHTLVVRLTTKGHGKEEESMIKRGKVWERRGGCGKEGEDVRKRRAWERGGGHDEEREGTVRRGRAW